MISNNYFVSKPKLGDYVCKRLSDNKTFYVDWTATDAPTTNVFEVDGEQYEAVGNAVVEDDGRILTVFRESATKAFFCRYEYKLTGYTLDGTNRQGTLQIHNRQNLVRSVVDYNATTKEQLVQQLNDFFAVTPIFVSQDWYAALDGDDIILNLEYSLWEQEFYITGNTGFTLTQRQCLEMPFIIETRVKHGGSACTYPIYCWWRALKVLDGDGNYSDFTPTNVVTSTNTNPVYLATYLGTSSYSNGDKCAFLRSVYGEGREGWLRFLMSCRPVTNTDIYLHGRHKDADKLNAALATKTFNSPKTSNGIYCPAANYAYTRTTQTLPHGTFRLMEPCELEMIFRSIKYPSYSSDRNSDPLNAARWRIGWSAIQNNTGHILLALYARGRNTIYRDSGILGAANAQAAHTVLPVAELKD